MKQHIKITLILLISIFLPAIASAQMTIDDLKPDEKESVKFRDSIRKASLETIEYYSRARHRAERAAIRKQRNRLEIISSLQGSLTSYNDPWVATSGGDNTTAITAGLTINHNYVKDKLTITSKLTANLGFNRVKIETGKDDNENPINEGVWFKNQDNIALSIAPKIAISPVWSYGPTFSFRTQFANGYISRARQESYEIKSGFMAPGYLDVSGAMTYKSPNKTLPFTISIAPLALSAVYVNNQAIIDNFCYNFVDHEDGKWNYKELYGLSPYVNSKYEGGSSIQIDFDKTFTRLNRIRYTTKVFSFYGWMTQVSYKNIVEDHEEYKAALAEWNSNKEGVKPVLGIRPTVRWENTISIPATNMLSTTIKFQLYYNKAQNLKIQTQTFLMVGLSYTYRNK